MRCALLVVLVALVSLPITGCQEAQNLLSGLDKPGVTVAGVRFTDISLEHLDLNVDLEITNPYSVDLPVAALDYDLGSSGQSFLSGRSDNAASIPANGKATYPFAVRLPFAGLLNVLTEVKPGSAVPYEMALGVHLDAPVVGAMRVPVEHAGELPVPAMPDVSVEDIYWKDISLTNVAAVLKLGVGNTNDFPIDLSELGMRLNLAGTQIGNLGFNEAVGFAGGQKRQLEIPLSFSPMSVGSAVLNMLTGSGSGYSLDGLLKGSTKFGDIELPFNRTGNTSFSR